nr:uncharacterized protein LOC117996580 isoform X1 [Maniola hyperantus]
MHRYLKTLFCALLLLSIVDPITSKRSYSSGRHSYPKPSGGGLSGGGHGYPSSGNSHGYPSSGGLSGTGGGHANPSSGGGHSYPSSGTHGSSGQSHGYPSGKGLSGNTPSHAGSGVSHTTNIHHHYNYNPPQQIRYTPTHGGPSVPYPVYHGSPPNYVYQYKDSGSKYGTLLAGLALLNLGTLGVATYAAAKAHSGSGQTYVSKPGEVCKFGLKKDNGDYEETKIDCNLISSFIFEEEAKQKSTGTNSTATVVTTTVTNVTTLNADGSVNLPPPAPSTLYEILPNGTLVPVNVTNVNTTASNNTAPNTPAAPGTVTSSVTITTTNTTTTDALQVKGKEVEVTPGMKCYVMRHSPTSNMKRSVPCGLLQTYATQSLKKNSASRNLPVLSILSVVVAIFVAY